VDHYRLRYDSKQQTLYFALVLPAEGISNFNQMSRSPCHTQCCPVHILHHFFCCSNTTNVTIVCGHNLTKLGVHPRNMNLIPSVLRASLRIANAPPAWFPCAFIILVLQTSIGEHLNSIKSQCVAVDTLWLQRIQP
jgi:hypothetical protein